MKEAMNERFRLNLEQKKKALLISMRKEIDDLNRLAEDQSEMKKRIRLLRNSKIALKLCNFIAPYAASLSVLLGVGIVTQTTPFVINETKQNLNIERVIDSFGNESYCNQYSDYNMPNTIDYYGKWNLEKDGIYRRIVKSYRLDKLNEEEIVKIVESNDIELLTSSFSKIVERFEEKQNVDEKERNEEAFLEARIYSVSENNYIYVKESVSRNSLNTLFYIMLFIAQCRIISSIREINEKSFLNEIEEIINNYSRFDTIEMKKLLNDKIKNYNRLTGMHYEK